MRSIISEKKIVIILFVMVLITFTLAQEDSRKMAKIQSRLVIQPESRQPDRKSKLTSIPVEKNPGITIITSSVAE